MLLPINLLLDNKVPLCRVFILIERVISVGFWERSCIINFLGHSFAEFFI